MKTGPSARENQGDEAVLLAERLRKSYRLPGQGASNVLNGIDFAVGRNETVGLVGGSGAGKSTIGRIVAGLEKPDGGRLLFEGKDLLRMNARERRHAAQDIQTVFQDPYESLSPRMTVQQLVAEPLVIRGRKTEDAEQRRELVREALEEVSLTAERYMSRYPHELSGGERQRVGLARAFICRPRLIVADEPTSMLDTSLRLELLQVMKRLSVKHSVSYLFITHDIALTAGFCDRLLVLNCGEIVEAGPVRDLIARPQHPYTQSLIGALKELDRF
ncbi:ABC transporter ATP-binding protein [Cohnella faecalis]|uniref:ABC transporter ATP-binding protein n=1 Tax=Cohnella faecalis TaxID=2315694 RepID=A0A398CLB3_9BACL|nr:ABC transporter ATP-binding protein [Cohnella faecalis]RIE04136.1 ABC transporter ATP-binding protein [Cohnella faecalis]